MWTLNWSVIFCYAPGMFYSYIAWVGGFAFFYSVSSVPYTIYLLDCLPFYHSKTEYYLYCRDENNEHNLYGVFTMIFLLLSDHFDMKSLRQPPHSEPHSITSYPIIQTHRNTIQKHHQLKHSDERKEFIWIYMFLYPISVICAVDWVTERMKEKTKC